MDKGINNWEEITHLQYADDTFIFCDTDREKLMMYLRVILIFFADTSGLYINWRRSQLYPVNKVEWMQSLAKILGSELGTLPTTSWECHWELKANQKISRMGYWKDVRSN